MVIGDVRVLKERVLIEMIGLALSPSGWSINLSLIESWYHHIPYINRVLFASLANPPAAVSVINRFPETMIIRPPLA